MYSADYEVEETAETLPPPGRGDAATTELPAQRTRHQGDESYQLLFASYI